MRPGTTIELSTSTRFTENEMKSNVLRRFCVEKNRNGMRMAVHRCASKLVFRGNAQYTGCMHRVQWVFPRVGRCL